MALKRLIPRIGYLGMSEDNSAGSQRPQSYEAEPSEVRARTVSPAAADPERLSVRDHNGGCAHDHGVVDPGPVSNTALVGVRKVNFKRSGRLILTDVSMDVAPGEIVTLIGPNGAGKTTLVRILLGLQTPDAGQVQRLSGVRIGYVPQRFDIDQALPVRVERFLELGTGGSGDDIMRALRDVGASHCADRLMARLSGGELQRVVLARALLRDPELLVLDEPVRGVDHLGEAELYTLIGRLRDERGFGVFLISHDLHVVMAASDRVICLNGHICCSGVPKAVARDPEYARLFGADAASAFAVYEHHHDHAHDLAGKPVELEGGQGASGRQE